MQWLGALEDIFHSSAVHGALVQGLSRSTVDESLGSILVLGFGGWERGGVVEEHWRWAFLLGAQASGARMWAPRRQAVGQQVPPGRERFPILAPSPALCFVLVLQAPSLATEPAFPHIVTP